MEVPVINLLFCQASLTGDDLHNSKDHLIFIGRRLFGEIKLDLLNICMTHQINVVQVVEGREWLHIDLAIDWGLWL